MAKVSFTRHCSGFYPPPRRKSKAERLAPRSPSCLHPARRCAAGRPGRIAQAHRRLCQRQDVRDRVRLTDPVGPHDEIFVLQALSGG
jgi:hypothetical protein